MSGFNPGAGDAYLLRYEYVEGIVEKRAPHREAHLKRINTERDAGRLFVAGAVGDPPSGAAIGFSGVSREHVEDWLAADPYVTAGLVVRYSVEPWKLV